jgi:hypothetical protein
MESTVHIENCEADGPGGHSLFMSLHNKSYTSTVGPVYITKVHKAVEVQPNSFLTSELDGVEW